MNKRTGSLTMIEKSCFLVKTKQFCLVSRPHGDDERPVGWSEGARGPGRADPVRAGRGGAGRAHQQPRYREH